MPPPLAMPSLTLAFAFDIDLHQPNTPVMSRPIPEWLLAAVGAIVICSAAFDWEFFMSKAMPQFFVRMLGRAGARIFYGLLGSALVALAWGFMK